MEKIECAAFTRDAAWISTVLDQCQARRFHGSVELIMEKGLVTRIRKTESLMPPYREGA